VRLLGVGQLRSLVGVSRLVTVQRRRVNVDGSQHVDLGVVSDSIYTLITPTQFH